MGKFTKKEKVISVRPVTCYLHSEQGEQHRIAMTNTGRIVMLDHAWDQAKLLRALTANRCCYDYVVGKDKHGRGVPRAFPTLHGTDVLTTPFVEKPTKQTYLNRVWLKADGAVTKIMHSLYRNGPYQYAMGIERDYSSDAYSKRNSRVAAKLDTPRWVQVPRGRTYAGILRIRWNIKMATDAMGNEDTLGVKYPMVKIPHRDSYNYEAGGSVYFMDDTAYFMPYIMELRHEGTRVVRGLLIDPNITALPRRVRFARACITPDNVILLSLEDIKEDR